MSMLSLFEIVITFFLFIHCQSLFSENICIWGRYGSTNTHINGLYTHNGTYDSAPYYNKTIDGDSGTCGIVGDHYLYYDITLNQWRIAQDTLGASSYSAYCSASTSNTVSCAVDWFISDNGFQQDTNVYVINDTCPEWNCNGISVSGSINPNCNGNFDSVEGIKNAFKKQGSNYWIYFVNHAFKWICSNALEPTKCPISYYASSTDGWEDLDPSDPILDKGDIGSIDCLSFPSNSPSPPVTVYMLFNTNTVLGSFSSLPFPLKLRIYSQHHHRQPFHLEHPL